MTVMAASVRPARRLRPRATGLMMGCALTALAIAGADRAEAQAINGTPSIQAGSVTFNRTNPLGPGTETITVNSPNAVVLWTLGSGVFLPGGNTLYFQGTPGNGNFTVLNRIVPNGQPIVFDGTVISRLSATNSSPAGTVAFYSPNGIVVGGGAVFNVNRLVLSTVDIGFDSAGQWITPGGQINFLHNPSAPAPGAIVIQPASTPGTPQINASPEGAYVAMFAPRIVQGGHVRANGAVAYVAGGGGTMTYNAGLFDIVVNVGTSEATALVHTGTTSGPASTGAADVHRIYAVAVPTSAATQMLLGGTLGFDAPLSASVENGAIVLSAGFNVVGDAPVHPANPFPGTATLTLSGATMTSDVTAWSTSMVTVNGANSFQQDLSIFSPNVSINAANNDIISVLGNLTASTAVPPLDPAQINQTGGVITVTATNGGQLQVGGDATFDASGLARVSGTQAGNGVGGSVTLSAINGAISVRGALTARANGVAPTGGTIFTGGSGQGGIVQLLAASNGRISAGSLVAEAYGRGGTDGGASSAINGTGGIISLTSDTNGLIDIAGATQLDAGGTGGDASAGFGGIGRGGEITIRSTGTGRLLLNGAVTARADGRGGVGGLGGGQGVGGEVRILADAGGRVLTGSGGVLSASGFGGGTVGGGAGGSGQGGLVEIIAGDGSTAGQIDMGSTGIAADGTGGSAVTGSGGFGTGGTVRLNAVSGGQLAATGAINASALGTGGTGLASGGAGTGGAIEIAAIGNGRVQTGAGSQFNVSGVGGAGGFAGGSGQGGSIEIEAGDLTSDGTVDIGAASLTSNGTGGAASSGLGGAGRGGTVELTAVRGQLNLMGATTLAANGVAGTGTTAGGASGGVLQLSATTATGRLNGANVTGTANASGAAAGSNIAGRWELDAAPGVLSFGTLTLSSAGDLAVSPASLISLDGGNLSVTGTATLSSAGDLLVSGGGAGQATGAAYSLSAARDIVITHATAGATAFNVTDFRADATRLFSLSTGLTAGQIRVTSADIDLASGARLGSAGTQLVSLTARPTGQQTVFGGTTQGPGYTLTNAEIGRITTGQLTLAASATSAVAGRPPDILVRDIDVSGPTVGRLRIEGGAGTVVQVEGALRMTNATASNGVAIVAGERIQVVTDTGSIRVLDGSDRSAGDLELAARNIWSADATTLALLTTNPAFSGRNTALLTNPGAVNERGYIEGGRVTLRAGDTLLIQNSGTGAFFAGLTVGDSLTITPTGTGPLDVYGFGRRLNAGGGYVTNGAFYQQISFDRTGVGYTDNAAFNDCLINATVCSGLLDGSVSEDEVVGPLGLAPQDAGPALTVDVSRWDCDPDTGEDCPTAAD